MEFYQAVLRSFIPIFFAIDVIGIIPLYMNMTDRMFVDTKNKTVNLATITALIVGVVFLYLGHATFKFLGITIDDFKIAGGLILLIFAIHDLLFSAGSSNKDMANDTNIGVVPIGMPLIVGPGVLTTLLLSNDINGTIPTLTSYVLNVAIVWFVFRYSSAIISKIGKGGAIAVGKVFSLLLAAVAVMMIRTGMMELLRAAVH